ncbi:hypothetical protein [Protaetiibacter mangrovi]|uniref:Uncharacterized protein n=1 Tax=Protaetiibacter mangrovi TaxID=2970926 RepID=A0ABT1ZHH5_9MICO|nr:hypothetical protein [Protaetiibacter mangrovi]MCS0500142.1 hypothetical protein [Protaetiibacter mangrovi]
MPTEAEVADAAWGAPEPPPRVWSSGRWSLELRGDELADIRCDGVLLARSLRFAARDRDWSTVPLADVASSGGLRVEARYLGLGARWDVVLEVVAGADRLDVRLDAVGREAWDRARVGLVLLHPPTVAGLPLRVTHPDGTATETAFPGPIAPHQPATEIAALAYAVHGLDLTVEFDGEVFEMEDHRNWTDASFKTYGTPLGLPHPVAVQAGERVVQRISLVVAGTALPPEPPAPTPIRLVPTGRPFPAIGLAASTEPGEGPDVPAAFHLVEVDVDAPGWRRALDRALDAAEAAGAAADVRLFSREPDALAAPVAALAGRRVVRLGATATRTQVTEPGHAAALAAAAADLDVELVVGARSHFTEVNRRLAELPTTGSLAFASTPGAHDGERAQLVESIAMQRLVVEQAARIGRPLHVGPVTLRPRYLTFAARPLPAPEPGIGYLIAPDATDPRQRSAAAAAWSVASAAALAVDGVASISYFETWGPRGIVTAAGERYPVAAAIDALAALAGAERLAVDGVLPADVWVAAARRGADDTVLIANLAPRELVVPFRDGRSATLPPLSWTRL